MAVSLVGETVQIVVSDSGRGFTPQAQEHDRSGSGLFLVAIEATRWGIRCDRRTQVSFELKVSSASDQNNGQEVIMTGDNNAAVLRRAYAAFNSGDMDTLVEIFDESVVWHLPGRSAFANDYQGRDATLAYFGQLAQETGGTFRAELTSALPDDEDRVVGIQRSSADRHGKHLDVGNCIVFQFKDGRVVDGEEHFQDLYAWDEFWA
jgi:uncharacterized protein